jgi:toxin ParE1/3/4
MAESRSFRLTPDAQSDLKEIRRFTMENWAAVQSGKYVSELRSSMHLLSQVPRIGVACADIAMGVFRFTHASHMIYYRIVEQQLVVFAVLHKSMVPMSHLEDRELT